MMEAKKPTSRKHHTVPRFYLSAFSADGTENEQLWVLDHKTGNQYLRRPEDLYIKDFYALESEEHSPDAFEQWLAKIDGDAAPVLRRLIEAEQFLDEKSMGMVMCFMSLMALRVSGYRSAIYKPTEQLIRDVTNDLIHRPEAFARWKQSCKDSGNDKFANVSLEDLQKFVEDGFEVKLTNQFHITAIQDALTELAGLLGQRRWTLVVAGHGEGEFICSDRPVGLHWTKRMPGLMSPGFALDHTEVTFPLSRTLGLLGKWEDNVPKKTADRAFIAMFNTSTAMHARFSYSSIKDYVCYANGRIASSQDIARLIRRRNGN